MENPSYYAVIEAEVRYAQSINADEKLMYGEIVALSNKNGYCNASNRYFSELYGVSIKTISTRINNLKKADFIKIELVYFENTKRVKERRLYLWKKSSIGYGKNLLDPIEEIVKDNNTSNNNTSNNIYSQNFLEIYNKNCSKLSKIQKLTEKRKKSITSFLKEFTESQFEEICKIANKSDFLIGKNDRKWKADFDFLLRPDKALKILEGSYNFKTDKLNYQQSLEYTESTAEDLEALIWNSGKRVERS